ncbi:alpha/beta hydrolase [Sphingobacterium sp. LRF_L2]|uniref:alpha/beta hydrolase n=1 Tax=Sphingobacterium sp. LRF_L2 TaxID=3369421 RepID=UPI003F61846A
MKSLIYSIIAGIFSFTICSNTSGSTDSIPEHETFAIQSEQLSEKRIINVWTPLDYKNNSDSLPVMYMADGGIEEDFSHVASTLAKLVEERKIKPLILVGIENTQRRRDLTGFTNVQEDKEIAPVVGASEKFRTFISQELFPEITKRYRTTDERSIIGESLSGLFVMETLFLKPEMFDNYIAFDPSLWWNNQYLINTAKEHLANLPTNEKRVWFAASNTAGIYSSAKQLADIFQSQNLPNLIWNFSNEPTETHSTIFKSTKEKALVWTLTKQSKP